MSSSLDPVRKLADRVPVPVQAVCEALRKAGFESFVVGGAVRDLVLGRDPSGDWDIATNARPEQVLELFTRAVPTGIAHGTVTVIESGMPMEVTTYRSEGEYSDGRRPDEVDFVASLDVDLARRDFTINAMALDCDAAEIRDPFGGAADLRAGIIRTVGRALDRFSEDGLRSLRAMRFISVLGFELDPETMRAVAPTMSVFRKVAVERVFAEMCKLLAGKHPRRALEAMLHCGLLAEVLPALNAMDAENRERAFSRAQRTRGTWVHRIAALYADLDANLLATALSGLKAPRREKTRATALVAHHHAFVALKPSALEIRRALVRAGREVSEDALILWEAEVEVGRGDREALSLARQELGAGVPLSTSELALDGQDVQRLLGVGAGPEVGRALRFLLDQVLEDPSRNNRRDLETLLRSSER